MTSPRWGTIVVHKWLWGESTMRDRLDITVCGIWLQGDVALRDAQLDTDRQYVEYHVPGFGPSLLVEDRRSAGINAYMQAVTPDGLARFPEAFDSPARVRIGTKGSTLVIELSDGQIETSTGRRLLWIAAGIEPEIPAWEYIWDEIVAADQEGRISIVAVVETDHGE